MSVNVAGFDAPKGGQGLKNKVSVAPLAIVAGLLFLVPGALESYLVYSMVGVALGFAVVGAILVLYGVSIWVAEALERKNVVQGSAAFGLGIFLVIEFFAFMAFFAGLWMMHLFSEVWPPTGTPEMPWGMSMVMMAIMFLSAIAVFVAGNRYKTGNVAGFRSAVTMAVVFGALFLGLRGTEYLHLLSIGFTPATNAYSTCYYGITAFHAISVLAGTGAFVAMLIPAMSGKIDKTFISAASMFWYFNTIACVFVVTQVYFWD